MPTQEEIMEQTQIPGQENGVAAIESLLQEGETQVNEAKQPTGVAAIESLLVEPEAVQQPTPVAQPMVQEAKPQSEGGFFQDTGFGRGIVSGTKEFLGSAGLALEESSLKVNDAFRWINDKVIKSDAFNQWIDEQDQRIEENISDVQEYKADVPEMQGGVGEFFGQLIPQTALFATAILSRNPLLAEAAVGTMGLSSVGSGLDTYEQYKKEKGEEVDELEKWGAGLAYGLAEFIPERIGLGFLMPKGVATKAAGKLMGQNIDQIAKTGKGMIEDLLKANPAKTTNLLKTLAQASSVEAGQEAATELMNMATDRYLTGMNISPKEFGQRLAMSAAGGAAMGGMLGPFSHFSQRAVDKARREAIGSVTVAQDEAGQTWELVNTKDGLVGFSPSGKVNKNLDPSIKDKAVTVPLEAFNRMVEGAREAGGLSDEMFREEQHRSLRQHVAQQLNTYGHTDGKLHLFVDEKDVDEATGLPREYFVISEDAGMAIMMDREGNRRIESAKDIAPKTEVLTEQEVFEQVRQRFDEQNPLEPITAESEPDTFTMQGKEYKVTSITPENLWVAAEIDENGATTGEVIQLTPEQQQAVTDELLKAPESKPDFRIVEAGGQQYKLVPTEDGNNIVDGITSKEEAEAAAQNIQTTLGEKLNIEVIRQDSGDAYTPDTYTVKLSERRAAAGEEAPPQPTYRFAGQEITRDDAMAYVAAAESAADLSDLEVEGDEELTNFVNTQFQPEYLFKGAPVSKLMAQAMIKAGKIDQLEIKNDPELEAQLRGPEEVVEEQPEVAQDYAAEEVTRVSSLGKEAEDGATMNLDGTKYEEGGLAVPVASMNTTQGELSREMINEFIEANQDKIPENSTVKAGLYKFPNSDQVSIDLNIVVPEANRGVALEFGKLAGQESLFDLTTGENVKTGADGKNPVEFNAAELKEIASSLAAGKLPAAVEATTKKQEPVNTKNEAALTQDFFSDVVTGKSDKYKPSKPWTPLLPFSKDESGFRKVFDKFKGNFDEHIATSIPGFRDVQVKVGNAISKMFGDKGGLVYDLGGSEGGFVKAITEDTGGKVKSINLDPNPDMQKVHEATPVEGSEFVPEAFHEGFDDFKAHKPTQKADVVHESMMFQFITNERAAYVKEVAEEYLKPDGLFITEEKFKLTDAEQQKINEQKKNKDYKTRFYTEQQINEKAEEVLVGMHENQANYDSYKADLAKHFEYVAEYWDGGNFKGLVASNSKEKIDEFLTSVGETTTEFSETQIKKQQGKDEAPAAESRGAQDLGQAEKEVNTEPTEAQKEAGNYKKGHTRVQGFDITIENPKGSTRSGTDQKGKKWSTKMNNTYGYFKRTKGKDGDQIDVFLGPNPENGKIFVVDQIDPATGKFDEHKVMMGFDSRADAIKAYKSNFSKNWQGMGPVVEVGKDAFTKWLNVEQTGKRGKRVPISFLGINRVKYPTNPANTTRLQFATQAQAAIKRVLSSVAPDTEVLLAETKEEFAKAIEGIKGANQNDKGILLTRKGKHTILINVPRMSTTTASHELSHVVFAELLQASPLHFNQFKEDVAKALEGRVRQELEDFVAGYDKVDRGEEFFAELTAMMTDTKVPRSAVQALKEVINKWTNRVFGFELFDKAAKAKDILDFFQNIADQIREGEVITEATIDTRKLGETYAKNLNAFESQGGSRELGDPITIKQQKSDRPVKVNPEGHDLSFVKESDLFDINGLIQEISDNGQKVWFWVADQLGRGMYDDAVIGGQHFLDAGPSYALNPKHKDKNILWASGMNRKNMEGKLSNSDYIFIMSGSPIRSKMFNKQVFDLFTKRVGDFDKFKRGLLRAQPTKPLREAIQPFKSWAEMKDSPKRKELMSAIYDVSLKKTDTPAKTYLSRKNAFVDPDGLRDGFYRDNDFRQNDIMMVLKPGEIGGKSDHSTYEIDVLGEVVGVPDKIVNAFDLMPDEIQAKVREGASDTQKSQVVAPYGAGVREIKFQKAPPTDSKAFKDWFGDSKVVDENGEPLVVYHGTERPGFTEFDPGEIGSATHNASDEFYFTDERSNAKTYSGTYDDADITPPHWEFEELEALGLAEENDGVYELYNPDGDLIDTFDSEEDLLKVARESVVPEQDGGIYEVYLSLKNPLEVDFEGRNWDGYNAEDDTYDDYLSMPNLEREAKDIGYDGVIAKNVTDEGSYGRGGELPQTTYIVFDPTQIKSATANVGTFDPENPDIRYQKSKPAEKQLRGFGDKVRNVFQDSMLAVRNWQESLEREGIKIRDFENAYMKENLSHGRILDKMDRFTDGQGKRLIDKVSAFVKAGNLTMDDARNYVVAKHGPERNRWFWSQAEGNVGQDFSGLTELKERVVAETKDPAEAMLLEAMPINDFADYYAQSIEGKVGKANVDALKKAVNDATDFALKEMRDSGFLSKEQYDGLKERYDYYVPLRGWSETLGKDGEAWDYASQFGKASSPMKKAKGRKSLADDPFAYILNMANTAVIAAERNKIAQATGNLVRNNRKAMEPYAEFKPVYFVKTDDVNEAGEPIIYETIDRPEQRLWDEGKVSMKVPTDYKKRKTQAQAKEHEVDFYENGQKMVLIMKDPEVARGLMGIKGTDWTTNWNRAINSPMLKHGDKTIIGAPGAATRYLSQVMTSMNPAFVLPNMARDIPLAILSEFVHGSTADAMSMIPNLRKAEGAVRRHLFGKQRSGRIDQLYDEFLRSGAATGFIHQKDVEYYRKELERGLREANKTMNPVMMASKGMRAGIDAVEKLAEWSENITRFAVYLNHRNKGVSADQAATEAKNSSVNFNRKGRLSPAINGLFAFFNAGVQAGDKYFKMWGANWPKMAAAHSWLAVQGFLAAMLMDLFGGDDEEGTRNYDKLSEYTRHNYLSVPVPGSEKVVTIPMPHVLRAFHGIGVSAYDMMTNRITAGEAVKNTIGSIPADIVPVDGSGLFDKDGNLSLKPFMPTSVKPLFELGMNENFMGYAISPEPYTPKQKDMIADTKSARKNANSAAQAITDFMYELGGGDETGYRYVEKNGELKKVPAMLDMSPHTLEHLVNSYLGGTGTFVGNVYKTSEGIFKTGLRMAEGDDFKKAIEEIQLNSTPVVRRFVRTPSGDPLMGSYYATKNEIDRWSQLIKFYENDMSIEGVTKYIDLWTKVGMPIETFKLQYDVIDKLNDSAITMQNIGDEAGMDVLEKEKRAAMKEAVKSWEEK